MEKILAIDLGKSNSVVCIFEKSSFTSEFRKIKTSGQVLHDLFVEVEPDIVLFEVGTSAGWISDILLSLKIPFKVANTNHPAWKWRNNTKKTDREDAYRLVTMYLHGTFPTVHMPSRTVRQKRSLIRYRQSIVKRVTQSKNTIRSILHSADISMAAGKSGWTQKSIENLRSLALDFDQVDSADELWKCQLHMELEILENLTGKLKEVTGELDRLSEKDEKVQLLKTIPGVGTRVAEAVVAIIDDPGRFKNAKHVSSYAGLVPRCYQSGQMERLGRITGTGNKMIRALLVEIGWLGLRYEWMRQIYDRVRRGTKSRSKIAIVALARHILVRCWAMLRDNSSWQGSKAVAVKS